MKKKFLDIIISIGMLVVGVCLLLWAEKVTNTVALIFGIVLLVYSAFGYFSYYSSKTKKASELMYFVLLTIGGLILVIKPNIVTELISFVIGGFVIIASVMKLRANLEYKDSSKYKMGFYLSIAGIIIGILCVVGKLIIPNIVLQFVGVLLIIYSVTSLINTVITPSKK